MGVFLLGVTPAGSALLDHQLYLPETWAADAARRKKTRVPAGDHVPDEAADRRRAGGAEFRAFRLDHGRRGVRTRRRFPRRPGSEPPALSGGGAREHDGLARETLATRRRTNWCGK